MPGPTEIVTLANFVIKNIPDYACLTNMSEFLTLLQTYGQVEINGSVTNVVISNQQPAESDRNKLWLRVTNVNSFVGFYIYASGKWNKIFPVDGTVQWIVGDSRAVPAGYLLVDANNPNFTAGQRLQLCHNSSKMIVAIFMCITRPLTRDFSEENQYGRLSRSKYCKS